MTKDSRVLVGVDGSPASLAALRWASRQAELTGGSLHAVTSWEYPAQFGAEFYGGTADWAELARTTLDTAVSEAGSAQPISCTRTVTQGHPAQVLVDASADADLLVVGSRGHGGFAGLLLGSVSEYVIAHAACPVLVIRHHQSPSAQEKS